MELSAVPGLARKEKKKKGRQGLGVGWRRWHFHTGVLSFWVIACQGGLPIILASLAITFLLLPRPLFLVPPITPTRSSSSPLVFCHKRRSRRHAATNCIRFREATSAWTTTLGIPLHHHRTQLERMTIAGRPLTPATLPAVITQAATPPTTTTAAIAATVLTLPPAQTTATTWLQTTASDNSL